jgi:EAL domain-containing protein (putative c-di-GMP-specific phosphodiesterase class I)
MHDSEKEPRDERDAALPLRPGDDLAALALARLGEQLPALLARFDARPLLGVVALDASALEFVERGHGGEARAQALARVGGLVRGIAEPFFGGDAVVVVGETGRLELAIVVCRESNDGAFVRQELPALVRALERGIESAGKRIVYPWAREAPLLGVGSAVMLRNPFRAGETQLRAALEEAREDAALARRVRERQRRQSFLGVLLSNSVNSVYEPIVEVATKTVYGYEALARGPEGTEHQTPLALFGAAEREGLVYELDCLCRRSGLEGARELPGGTRLFLNVRPTAIHDPQFRPDTVVRTLSRANLTPNDVVFEISEQESIANFSAFREIRDEYRSLGFQFALDDTGAGYASLHALIELEPEFIKVDRALITNLDTDASKQNLLRALQLVADGIGARIIGEGLDTLEELDMLGQLGIPFGQGWLFGHPTPLRAR